MPINHPKNTDTSIQPTHRRTSEPKYRSIRSLLPGLKIAILCFPLFLGGCIIVDSTQATEPAQILPIAALCELP